MSLEEIIIKRIEKEGPISFHDYMEMALYYPSLGYYTSPGEKIGTNGDYYTSTVMHQLYGKLLGRQIEEMWELSADKEFSIVEYGGGTGKLCATLLDYFEQHKNGHNIHYYIIEKSPVMIEQQKVLLEGRVSWCDDIAALSSLKGCVLAHEVIDNFPVHRVVKKEQALMEIFVDHQDGFAEILQPASPALINYLEWLDIRLADGFCAEINLQAIEWLDNVFRNLEKGFLLIIDYGFLSARLYSPERKNGTLRSFRSMRMNDLLYQDIGKQDITAHVNFSALLKAAVNIGFKEGGITGQFSFLHAAGITAELREMEKGCSEAERKKLNDVLLTMLLSMGQKFKVLMLEKGITQRTSGMIWGMPLQDHSW